MGTSGKQPKARAGRGSHSRRGALRRAAAVVVVSTMLVPAWTSSSVAQVGGCAAGDLKPQLREFMVNQGLPTALLVRGKEALVKLYLSKPACATDQQNIQLTSATLEVYRGGSLLTPALLPTETLNPAPPLVPFNSAPAASSTSDPVFAVPGSFLTSSSDARFTLSFVARLRYTTTATSGEQSLPPIDRTETGALTATVEKRTNPLKILAIPMGDPTKTVNTTATQYSDAANNAVIAGFDHLSRMFPGAGGVGDLATPASGGGVRYLIDRGATLDVKSYMNAVGKKFCGTPANFANIAPHLGNYLAQYNTANGTDKAAERVMGVIDQLVSTDCAQGMAAVEGKETWVRALHKDPEPRSTGSLMAMEVAHNYGVVPDVRDHPLSDRHSPRSFADFGYTDRGYNLFTKKYLADDRTAMSLTQGWDNNNTLLEKLDWDMMLCRLGGQATADCSTPSTVPSAPAPAAQVAVLVGTTGGTSSTTQVRDSYVSSGPQDAPNPSSSLRLIQRGQGGEIVSNLGVRTTALDSIHSHDADANHTHRPAVRTFSIAYPVSSSATRLELVEQGTVLYARDKNAGPAVSSMTITPEAPTCEGSSGIQPSDVAGTGEFGADAQKVNFDLQLPGTAIGEQYRDQGVVFTDDDIRTPHINGLLERTTTGPAGVPLPSLPSSLPNSLGLDHDAPLQNSKDLPLEMSFISPVRKVGMFVGNGETGTDVALHAYNCAGRKIFTARRDGVTDNVDTFIGIDSGTNRIAKVRLDYGDSSQEEEIDDLHFERSTGSDVPGESAAYAVEVSATDPDPELLRFALFSECKGTNMPLYVGEPGTVDGNTATAQFRIDSASVCGGSGELIIKSRVNDGFTTTPFTTKKVESGPDEPLAVISSPNNDGLSFLEHEAIHATGEGWDPTEGVLPASNMTWYLTGPGGVETKVGTGRSVAIPAPAGGRAAGDYTLKLVVTDAAGISASTTRTVASVTDDDNDGVEERFERCSGTSDQNPFDSTADFDQDGRENFQDPDPCVAELVDEVKVTINPKTLNLSSSGSDNSITVKVQSAYRDLEDILPASVRISKVGGAAVTDPTLTATSWSVNDGVAQAKFDRQALIRALNRPELTDRYVIIEITGQPLSMDWSIAGGDQIYSKSK